MAIPDYQTLMLPLIEALADDQERTMRELTDQLERFPLDHHSGFVSSG